MKDLQVCFLIVLVVNPVNCSSTHTQNVAVASKKNLCEAVLCLHGCKVHNSTSVCMCICPML